MGRRPKRFRRFLRPFAAAVLLAGGVVAGGCGSAGDSAEDRFAGQPIELAGLLLPARVEGDAVQLATPDGFRDRFWPGVNLGTTVPGRQPGEVAPRGDDYRRWFAGMGELGVRVIRVYTLLHPSFYAELARYNALNPDAPLYVLHGISIPEDRLLETGDLFDPEVMREQRRFTEELHAAVRGDLHIPRPRLGEAHGRWETDISRWVIGWSFGIEMDPVALERSEARNGPRSTAGRYITTRGEASSTEAWLAEQLDHLASLDARHGWSRPITFTNWATLDPLEHEYEPLPLEDLISLDAMHLTATDDWPGGFFASYHAYPYYPDFLRFTPRYAESEDAYATYLADLRDHHADQAVMITEFGVPSSLGAAHRGQLGRDQGHLDEAVALGMDAEMLAIIHDQGFSGGIVFAWADEWFKRTWNTIDLELPEDRRQLWRNPLTNEGYFGLIATEAGLESSVEIDGQGDEWESVPSQTLWEAGSGLLSLRAAHDEAYLYLVLELEDPSAVNEGVTVGLDVRPGGNRGLPGLPGSPMPGADTSLRIGPDAIQVRRAAWTDELAFQYGLAHSYLPGVRRRDLRRGSGVWREPAMILNRPLTVPVSGAEEPVELLELGELPLRPQAADSRTIGAAEAGLVELRVPWAMLGFADPSSRTLTAPQVDGTIATTTLPADRGIGIEVYDAGGERLAEADPGYGWEPWQQVEWSERRKRGWEVLATAFAQTGGKVAPGAASPSIPILPIAVAGGGVAVLGALLLLALVRRRRRPKRVFLATYRRRRIRKALLAADGPAIEAVVRPALDDARAQSDLAWVLRYDYPALNEGQRSALQAAVRDAALPRTLVMRLDARRSRTRDRARMLLEELRVAESEALLDELKSDPEGQVRRATAAWLATKD